MDFVTKALGSLNIGLPFTLEDEIDCPNQPWKLYNATLKKDSSEVSVFSYEESALSAADNATAALRKLKLPGVVKHLETVSKGSQSFIITERVVPWDVNNLSIESRKFVLSYILQTLGTLESVAKCHYNGLVPSTIMQSNTSGLPVLVGFDFATFEPSMQIPLYATNYSAYPVPSDGWSSPTLNTYQFGCVAEYFVPMETRFITSLKSPRRVAISKLASSTSASSVLQNPITGIVNEIGRTLLLAPHELKLFCEQLVKLSGVLYEGCIRNTILPELLKSKDPCIFLAVLTLVSQLKTSLPDDSLATQYITNHFSMLDRVIRIKLLQYLPDYINLLSNRVVQQKIMPKMAFGFSDTEAVVRNASVAATEYLVDKLTSAQLNSELLRLLSKTHADSDPDIRALTTTVLCHIAPKLNSRSVISTALARALKDPVAKCRNAALLGVSAIDVPPKEIAEKLLSSAALGMLDSDPTIAADAWRVTYELLGKIQVASKASGPAPKPVAEPAVKSGGKSEAPVSKVPPATTSRTLQSTPVAAPEPVPSPFSTLQKATFTPHGDNRTELLASNTINTDDAGVDEDAWGWGEETNDNETNETQVSDIDEDAWGW